MLAEPFHMPWLWSCSLFRKEIKLWPESSAQKRHPHQWAGWWCWYFKPMWPPPPSNQPEAEETGEGGRLWLWTCLLHLRALGLVTPIVTVQNPSHRGRRLSGPWLWIALFNSCWPTRSWPSVVLLSIATGGKAVLSMLRAHFFSCRWAVTRLGPHTEAGCSGHPREALKSRSWWPVSR